MEASQEPEIKKKFKELYVDYKLAVTAAYFARQSEGHMKFSVWEGPHDIKATQVDPVLERLATPKLDPELAEHLLQRK